jgi:hypothetical protein
MFIGRGFDSDGDGDDDLFVGTKLQPLGSQEIRFLALLCILGGGIWAICYAIINAADRQGIGVDQWIKQTLLFVLWLSISAAVVCICAAVIEFLFRRFGVRKGAGILVGATLAIGFMGIRQMVIASAARAAQDQAARVAAAEKAEQEEVTRLKEEILRKARNAK